MLRTAGLGFYYGSNLLEPVANYLGLTIDQANFIACQLLSMIIAIPFRMFFHPSKVSAAIRHCFEIIVGVALVYFCFGNQVLHILCQMLLCYIVMLFSPQHVHHICFPVTLAYLSVLHIYRQIYDYGNYTLDITGPLMITTQKLSDLAFSVHDGMVKEEKKLSDSQLKYAQKNMPTLLELSSYIFSFHNVMIGPTVFYQDYKDFITGKNIGIGEPAYTTKGIYETPKGGKIFVHRAAGSILFALITTQICPLIPPNFSDPSYVNSGFLYKIVYTLISVTLVRAKYYFAWSLAELTNMAAGLGFTGYNKDGSENWDVIQTADIWNIEFCTSIKVNIDSWNISTLKWLRRVVYDRAPAYHTALTMATSAFWHGFYPGYYLCFATGTVFLFANRSIRRFVRPMFQQTKPAALLYDVITFVFTRFCNVYMCTPFLTLELQATLQFYMSQYFWLHILAMASILFIPSRPSSRAKSE